MVYWLVSVIQNDSSSEKADKKKFALCEDLYIIGLYVTWRTGNKVNYSHKTW